MFVVTHISEVFFGFGQNILDLFWFMEWVVIFTAVTLLQEQGATIQS